MPSSSRLIVRLLLLVGYALAVPVVVRWVPVVRERRWRWFVAHQAGMTAIVAGWALRGTYPAAAANGAWLAAAAAWYARGLPFLTPGLKRGHQAGLLAPPRPGRKDGESTKWRLTRGAQMTDTVEGVL